MGNFSQTIAKAGSNLVTIYNPFSTVVTNGKAVRQPFSGNMITPGLLNPIGTAALASLLAPLRTHVLQVRSVRCSLAPSHRGASFAGLTYLT